MEEKVRAGYQVKLVSEDRKEDVSFGEFEPAVAVPAFGRVGELSGSSRDGLGGLVNSGMSTVSVG